MLFLCKCSPFVQFDKMTIKSADEEKFANGLYRNSYKVIISQWQL